MKSSWNHLSFAGICSLLLLASAQAQQKGLFAASHVDEAIVAEAFLPVYLSFYWDQHMFFTAHVKYNPDGTPSVQYDPKKRTAIVSISVAVNETVWQAWKDDVSTRLQSLPQSNAPDARKFKIADKEYHVSPAVFKRIEEIAEFCGPYPDWGILVQLLDSDGNLVANQLVNAHCPRGSILIKAEERENICGNLFSNTDNERYSDGVYWLADALQVFSRNSKGEWSNTCPSEAVFHDLSPAAANKVVSARVHVLGPKTAKRFLLDGREPFSISLGEGIIVEMMPTPGGIWMGKTEVTQAVWEKVTGTNPVEAETWKQRRLGESAEADYLKRFVGPNLPVSLVSRSDCLDFIQRLNILPEVSRSGYVFRLPEDREWNLAARGNLLRGDIIFQNGDGDVPERYYGFGRANHPGHSAIEYYGWFRSNCEKHTHPVATKSPNEFGLFDMVGNVSEIVGTIPPQHTLRAAERHGSSGQSDNPFEWGDFISDFADYDKGFEWIGFRLAAERAK